MIVQDDKKKTNWMQSPSRNLVFNALLTSKWSWAKAGENQNSIVITRDALRSHLEEEIVALKFLESQGLFKLCDSKYHGERTQWENSQRQIHYIYINNITSNIDIHLKMYSKKHYG